MVSSQMDFEVPRHDHKTKTIETYIDCFNAHAYLYMHMPYTEKWYSVLAIIQYYEGGEVSG